MAASGGSGSRSGRPAVDWEQAFQYYASLPDPERSYRAVAERFGVSVRTVEKRGCLEGWKQRLAGIRAEAAEQADAQLADARAEKLAELDLLIDASFVTYAHQLSSGLVRVGAVDLPRLYKLREDMWAQIAAEQNTQPAQLTHAAETEDPQRRRLEVVRALHEAGAFQRLQNLIDKEER